ncbi:MAG: ABC transporter permease [Coxiellaceae bacterium]|jgi:putative ABC transport system permease protein|nr:ABC transporter permease [Coxiellaceae bacterium]
MLEALLIEVWQALITNRLRTFLTVLGMMIGVGAVVLMGAIGEGVQDSINKMISSMGSNLLVVLSGSTTSRGGMRMGTGVIPTLTQADAEAIAGLPHVLAVSPMVHGNLQIVYGSNNWSTSVVGVTPSYFNIREWPIEYGECFTNADVRSANRVVLIGKTVADVLFGAEDPVGKIIRIQKNPYLVTGLLSIKGQSLDGKDHDDAVFVPLTTAQRKLFGTKFQGTVRFILVQASSLTALTELINPITDLLRERHHLARSMDNDFNIQNLTVVAEIAMQAAKLLSLLLGAIASISLVVGGIGIMNIMLVSVTERTREIGIRSALGACRRDILSQFLLEALVISLAGCVVGIFIGISGALLVNKIFNLNIIISLQSILLALGVASGVGVFFGYYPARKAAYLKPIEAIRYQ